MRYLDPLSVKFMVERNGYFGILTTVDCFFLESPSGFHIQIVLPLSAASRSEAESITAYVNVSSCEVVRETDAQEKEVEGPSVCETTGCDVATYHPPKGKIPQTQKVCSNAHLIHARHLLELLWWHAHLNSSALCRKSTKHIRSRGSAQLRVLVVFWIDHSLREEMVR